MRKILTPIQKAFLALSEEKYHRLQSEAQRLAEQADTLIKTARAAILEELEVHGDVLLKLDESTGEIYVEEKLKSDDDDESA
jgi:uncharacterized membrane protein